MIIAGDIGSIITITLGEDCSLASDLAMRYEKPSGEMGEWAAVAYGTTGIQYVTGEGDIDEAGTWNLQAIVTFSPILVLQSNVVAIEVGTTIEYEPEALP